PHQLHFISTLPVQSPGCYRLCAIRSDPAEAAGNLRAGAMQLVADGAVALLTGKCIERPGDIDCAQRLAGKIEHRHRGRADAALEVGLTPGDAGAPVLLGLRLHGGERGRGVLAETL